MFRQLALAAVLIYTLAAPVAEATQLLVPAYWGAYGKNQCNQNGISGAWAKLAAAGDSATAIINPNSGPDYSGDDSTHFCVPPLVGAGVQVIGYVATGYGERSLDNVYADVMQYKKQMAPLGMTGIFLDEGTSWWDTPDDVAAYYTKIAAFIREQAGFDMIFINSGTRIAPQFLTMADVVVGFEARQSQWTQGNMQGICATPTGASRGDAGYCRGGQYCINGSTNCRDQSWTDLAAVIFCASSTNWMKVLRAAQAANYAYVYVTNDGCGGTNPYNTIPTFWDTLRTSL